MCVCVHYCCGWFFALLVVSISVVLTCFFTVRDAVLLAAWEWF